MAIQTLYQTSDRLYFTDLREAQEHEDELIAREDLCKWGEQYLNDVPVEIRRCVIDRMWGYRSELLDLLQTQA